MRLDRHEVSGFFHFDQPLVIEPEALTAGLIAVVGPNGAGKTSLCLDAPLAGVYGPGLKKEGLKKVGAFPSREGNLSDYSTSRAAFIDDLWTIEGRGQFRLRVNVDGVRRVVDAVVEQVFPDGTRRPLNDGKVSTFSEVIQDLFPARQSVLASAFAAQTKKGSFNELGQKERMELFVELADLAHYEERSQAAGRCAKIADGFADRLRSALEVLRRDVSEDAVNRLGQRGRLLTEELKVKHDDRRAAEGQIGDLESMRPAFAADAERHAVASARVQELQASLKSATENRLRLGLERDELPKAHEYTVSKARARHKGATDSVQTRRYAAIDAHNKAQADRTERIANNRKVLEDADGIRAAAQVVQDAEGRIYDERAKATEYLKLAEDARQQIRVRERELDKVDRAKVALASAQSRAGLLSQVKFGEECGVDPACPLVTDAVIAKVSIPELEGAIVHEPNLRAGIVHWTAIVNVNIEAHQGSVQRLDESQKSRDANLVKAKLEPHLAQAESRIAEYQWDAEAADVVLAAALEGMAEEVRHADAALAQELTEAEVASAAKVADIQTLLEKQATKVLALKGSIEAEAEETRQTAGAKQRLDEIDAELRLARTNLMVAQSTLSRLEAELAEVQRQQADVASKSAQITEAERRLRLVEDEGLAWQTLARACGRDGLQRLEIDSAGPVVSDLANQLLRVGWGTRFSIDIVTQVATADGKDMKERFTILVTDNEHAGEPRDIGDLSGGEGVVVNEAVRAALSCYVNLRSRRPCRTIWRDEADGALHEESGPKYVAMLRKLRELSGAEHLFFISHKPECFNLADAQIHVRNGQATVVRPPYAEAA